MRGAELCPVFKLRANQRNGDIYPPGKTGVKQIKAWTPRLRATVSLARGKTRSPS